MTKTDQEILQNVKESVDLSKEKKERERYISKSGFEEIDIKRGFENIKNVFYDIKDKGFFCGGYVRYMCSPRENPVEGKDIDIYCNTEENFEEIKKILTDNGLQIKNENNMSVTFETIEDKNHRYYSGGINFQLVKPVLEARIVAVGSMEKILSNFDFTVVRCGLLSETKALVDCDFIHDEKHRNLRLKNIHCPVSSTLRCMKYSRKGYWLSPFQALTLFVDWENRDDEYRIQLIDFLQKTEEGGGLTQEEVEHLEAMMRID